MKRPGGLSGARFRARKGPFFSGGEAAVSCGLGNWQSGEASQK